MCCREGSRPIGCGRTVYEPIIETNVLGKTSGVEVIFNFLA
jgi:hypothetical protein